MNERVRLHKIYVREFEQETGLQGVDINGVCSFDFVCWLEAKLLQNFLEKTGSPKI